MIPTGDDELGWSPKTPEPRSREERRDSVSLDVDGRIRWASKVSPDKIGRLYRGEASGLLDEELLDEVAYAFYARCQSILTATEASAGRVACARCGEIILREGYDKDQVLTCPACGWEVLWGSYYRSYKGKQLHGGGAVHIFEGYVARLPQVETPSAKMMLVDRIIHACHRYWNRKTDALEYTRPVAVNLIEGHMKETVAFLDALAYGVEGVPDLDANREVWRKRLTADWLWG